MKKGLLVILLLLTIPSAAAEDQYPLILGFDFHQFIDNTITSRGGFTSFSVRITALEEISLSNSTLYIRIDRDDENVPSDDFSAYIYFGNETNVVSLVESYSFSKDEGEAAIKITELQSYQEFLEKGESLRINGKISFYDRGTYEISAYIYGNDTLLANVITFPVIQVLDPVEYATLKANVKIVESSVESAEEAKRANENQSTQTFYYVLAVLFGASIPLLIERMRWKKRGDITARDKLYGPIYDEISNTMTILEDYPDQFTLRTLETDDWKRIKEGYWGVVLRSKNAKLQSEIHKFYDDFSKFITEGFGLITTNLFSKINDDFLENWKKGKAPIGRELKDTTDNTISIYKEYRRSRKVGEPIKKGMKLNALQNKHDASILYTSSMLEYVFS